MKIELGRVEAIFRHPVKSMRGEPLEASALGWHGLEGDRRLALRRLEDRGGFPFLTASSLPELVRFEPRGRDEATGLPTHVRTPEGDELPLYSEALAAEIARRHGAPVQMMHLKHGIFDEAPVSVITSETIAELSRMAGVASDVRRFRPNVLVKSVRAVAFEENDWVGGVITFGDGADAPAVNVTMRDVRCAMLNIDPEGGPSAPGMMKAVVKANGNDAGVYAAVTRVGRVEVGQRVVLSR